MWGQWQTGAVFAHLPLYRHPILGWEEASRPKTKHALIRGAISLIVGMVVILMAIFTVGDRLMAAWLLAAGLLAAGVLTIVAPFFEGDVGVKRGDLLMTAFLLILGGLLTYNIVTGVDVLQILAWTLIVFGAALIVFGILARSRADVAEA